MSARHAIPGRHAVEEALRAGRPLDDVLVADSAKGLDDLVDRARTAGVPVRRAPRHELDAPAGGAAHQGVIARGEPPPMRALGEVTEADLLVICDGITDPHNLGSIARSAEAAGAAGIVLPRRRSAAITPAAEKSAAGAFSWLPVVGVPNVAQALTECADAGLWTVGLDGDAATSVYACALLDERVALVVGAEGHGLARLVRERVDERIAIPLAGRIASLNAAVAAGVALFEVRRRRA